MRKNSFFWKMVRSSISRRKSRMFTALLAIAMGATILSGLVTIYYDIPRQLGKEFRSYGANLIVIPGDASSKIEEKQVQEIRSAIGAQKLVGLAPYIYQNAKINEQPYIVAGTDMEGLKNNSPFWLVSGEWPTKPREVMLGAEIAKNRTGVESGCVFKTLSERKAFRAHRGSRRRCGNHRKRYRLV